MDNSIQGIIKQALMGAVQGNIPMLGAAVGSYVTFRDKPWAMALGILQLQSPMLKNAIWGAGTKLVTNIMGPGGLLSKKSKSSGQNPRRRRNRNKNNRKGKR